jgi:hypothetical protein
MKFLAISVISVIILLGLLFMLGRSPKYMANIIFFDGQTNQMIPNQDFYLTHYDRDMGESLGTKLWQTDSNGYADIFIVKISKSVVNIEMLSPSPYKSDFLFRIESRLIEENATISVEAKDLRSDKKKRDTPITPPRLEIKVGKRKFF